MLTSGVGCRAWLLQRLRSECQVLLREGEGDRRKTANSSRAGRRAESGAPAPSGDVVSCDFRRSDATCGRWAAQGAERDAP